jgi:putative endonuclease
MEYQEMARKNEAFFVYILHCGDGSYYTGYSNNPTKRFNRHLKGQGARYTRMHKPTSIIYLQSFESRAAAMKRERQIKMLRHDSKRNLIEKNAATRICQPLNRRTDLK